MQSLEKASGMSPLKLLFRRSSTEAELLMLPKHCGSLPLKLLLDNWRITRDVRLQIAGGISPFKRLSETL